MTSVFYGLVISLIAAIVMGVFDAIIPKPDIYHYVSFLVILVLLSILFPFLLKIWTLFIRTKRRFFPSIAILNGNVETPVTEYKCKRSNIFITPSMWFHYLKQSLTQSFSRKINFNIQFIPLKKINDSFSMIINPFGDNFPEEDTTLLTSFYKICNYVDNGGFYVCTGGAFYAHQNTKNSDTEEQVIIKMNNNSQLLTDTLLYKKIGILPSGDDSLNERQKTKIYQNNEEKAYLGDILGEISSVKKFRATSPESSNFIPLVREITGNTFPIVAIQYGKGFFIHFGLYIESADSDEFKIIENVVDRIIKKKFKIY